MHIPGTTVIDPRRVLLTMSDAEENPGEQSPTLVDVGSDRESGEDRPECPDDQVAFQLGGAMYKCSIDEEQTAEAIIQSLTDNVTPAGGPVATGDMATAEQILSVSAENPSNNTPNFMEYQVGNVPDDLTLVSVITAVQSGPEETREAANLQPGVTGEGLNLSHPLGDDDATAHVLSFSSTPVVDAFQNRREGAADVEDENGNQAVDKLINLSDDDDASAVSQNQKSSAHTGFGMFGQRSAAQQAKLVAKRKRNLSNKKARKEAVKAASTLANDLQKVQLQVVVDGKSASAPMGAAGKRAANNASASGPTLKKSRRVETPLERSLADYLKVEQDFSTSVGKNSSIFLRHGPLTIPRLRAFAHTSRAVTQNTSEAANLLGHPTDALRDSEGLFTLALDPQTSSVSQVETSVRQRSGTEPTAQLTFFGSDLFSLAGQIEQGQNFSCPHCLSAHWPLPRTKTVLVTASEVIAAAGFPRSITCPGVPHEISPPVSPGECWDRVWILGGLRSDPSRVLKASYANVQGELVFLLDLGAVSIEQGESAFSVRDRLWGLVRFLKESLRNPAKGATRVICLPPLIHLGAEDVALHQEPPQPLSKLALREMLSFAKLVNLHNTGLVEGTRTPLHTWGEFVSTVGTEVVQDHLLRSLHEVRVQPAPTSHRGGDGVLHLKPAALHKMVRSVVAFVKNNYWLTW